MALSCFIPGVLYPRSHLPVWYTAHALLKFPFSFHEAADMLWGLPHSIFQKCCQNADGCYTPREMQYLSQIRSCLSIKRPPVPIAFGLHNL